MKPQSVLLLFALIVSGTAAADTVKCKLRVSDLSEPVIGIGDQRALAQADAIEKCVDRRAANFERQRGPLTEDRYAAFIDSCQELSCEK